MNAPHAPEWCCKSGADALPTLSLEDSNNKLSIDKNISYFHFLLSPLGQFGSTNEAKRAKEIKTLLKGREGSFPYYLPVSGKLFS